MCEEEETLTFEDVLAYEAQLEETTNAVLGGSDNKNCSYSKGYVDRQALYACLTCTPLSAPDFSPAGICLACSLKCHDGHELVELYTKRNFRCDCGNKKFPDSPCSLEPKKDDYNTLNSYNQNFQGLYCECHRPYPDPEEDEEEDDEMIQCIVCEDWFHGRHTGNDSYDLDSEQAAEFVCEACTKKNDFLTCYPALNLIPADSTPATITAEKPSAPGGEAVDVDVCDGVGNDLELEGKAEPASCTQNPESVVVDVDSKDSGVSSKDGSISDPIERPVTADQTRAIAGTSTAGCGDTTSATAQKGGCLIEGKLALKNSEINGGTWWSVGWRLKLCCCSTCLELYKNNGVSFLIDTNDSLEAYEAKGASSGTSSFETSQALMQNVLSRLDRVAQIEFLHGFNEMKDALVDYLRKIGDSGRVVTATDIREFFSEMQASKRRRLDEVHIPDNCR